MKLPSSWESCNRDHDAILFTSRSCPVCELRDELDELTTELNEANQAADYYSDQFGTLRATAQEFQEKCVCGQLANERII